MIFAFYEELLLKAGNELFDIRAIFRSCLLLNTTVMLAMTIKWYGLYRSLMSQQTKLVNKIEITADRRTHLIDPKEILHIEGLGNYIKIYLPSQQTLTTYSSIKNILNHLPEQFIRCHRSHVINTSHIDSFNNDNIYIGKSVIPRGKDIKDTDLVA